MWEYMALDMLSHIFSFLPPHSIAQCLSTSKHWQTAAHLTTTTTTTSSISSTWLLAMPTRAHCNSCLAYSPSSSRWHSFPLHFLTFSVRPIAPVGPLMLCKLGNSLGLRLLVVNVFTKQYRFLPTLASGLRSNAAVGVILHNFDPGFQIFVAGGASGASYDNSVEIYDSRVDKWSSGGTMPLEYAIRLTVWTPNENVYCEEDGAIYWMTSARAYSIVGFSVKTKAWREVKVPKADKLEWATIVKRSNGKLGLVGGVQVGKEEGFVWELCEGDGWKNVGYVPRMEGENGVKCVDGGYGLLWLFRQIGGSMLVGDGNDWSWNGDGEWCCLPRISMKVMAIKPSLSRLTIDS